MKPRFLSLVLTSSCLAAFSCAEFTNPTRVTSAPSQTVYEAQAVHWSRKPRVAVMEFEDKTGTAMQVTHTPGAVTVGNPIGAGMKEQLVTALAQTNAFIILEREALQDVMREQELGHSGRFRRETSARVGELEGAELLIYGAVTAYKPSQASVAAGGGTDPLLGAAVAGPAGAGIMMIAKKAIGGFMKQDYIAIDIRLVDANTGRIVTATSVEATPRDFGGVGGGIFGDTLLLGAAQYSTPIQKAVRACTVKAVNWIAENAMSQGLLRKGTTPSVASPPRVNSDLREAQEILNGRGYQCGVADGMMGSKTRSCLRAFQQDEGLPVTGTLDAPTLERVRGTSGSPRPAASRGDEEW